MSREEINGPVILSTYKMYLGINEAFETAYNLLINGNTPTKIEVYRRFKEAMEILKPSPNMLNTGDPFLDNCVMFVTKYFEEVDAKLYEITSDDLSNSDDSNLLKDLQ